MTFILFISIFWTITFFLSVLCICRFANSTEKSFTCGMVGLISLIVIMIFIFPTYRFHDGTAVVNAYWCIYVLPIIQMFFLIRSFNIGYIISFIKTDHDYKRLNKEINEIKKEIQIIKQNIDKQEKKLYI